MGKRKIQLVFLLLSIIFLALTSGAKSSSILQNNIIDEGKLKKKINSEPKSNNNTKRQEPGVIRTAKAGPKDSKNVWMYSDYMDWNKIQETVHSQKEVILYCSCVGILMT